MTEDKWKLLDSPMENFELIIQDKELIEEFKKRSIESQNKVRDTKPWDLLNNDAPKATEEEAQRRYKICTECPELLKVTKQCKMCGCFMKLKVKLEESRCPIGKW